MGVLPWERQEEAARELAVSFTTGLAFLHNGRSISRTRSSDGKSWTANLRAEVGLLSRNVKIQGDAESETGGFGGHIMVMNGGSSCCLTSGRGFIEGVELYRMDQEKIVGRYPMHWHMCAESAPATHLHGLRPVDLARGTAGHRHLFECETFDSASFGIQPTRCKIHSRGRQRTERLVALGGPCQGS